MADVQATILKNESGTISLYNLPTGIIVEENNSDDFSQKKLATLVYNLAHMQAVNTVATVDDDRYGFEMPSAQASLLLPDTTVRLTLGRKSSIGDMYYLKSNQSEMVYLISSDNASVLLQGIHDFQDLRLYPNINPTSENGLKAIMLEHSGEVIELGRLNTDTTSSFFGMVRPVVSVLDWERVYRSMLAPLAAFEPKRFVSQGEDLGLFCLDEPEYVLTLLIDDMSYKCLFSHKDPNTYYCTLLGSDIVCEADVESTTFLQIDYMDLIGNSIYTRSVADLSGLGASFDDRHIVLDIYGEGDTLTASSPTHQFDKEEILAFYKKADSIPVSCRLNGDEAFSDFPELVLSFALRSGGEDILEFYSISDRQYAVCINGRAEFATYASVVDELKKIFVNIG